MVRKAGGNTLLILCCLSGVLVLVGLGSWQVQRLFWKQDLMAVRQDSLGANPVSLRDVEAGIENGFDVDFLRVTAEGYYRHDLERFVYDLRDGRIGWRVVTPLVVPGELIVLIDRGFVLDEDRDVRKRLETTTIAALSPELLKQGSASWPAPVQVTGHVRLHAHDKGWFTPANDARNNRWYSYDLEALSRSLPEDTGFVPPDGYAAFVPVFIQVEPGGEPETGEKLKPVALDAKLPNNHLQYAITWYALAVALTVIGLLVLRSRRRSTNGDGSA